MLGTRCLSTSWHNESLEIWVNQSGISRKSPNMSQAHANLSSTGSLSMFAHANWGPGPSHLHPTWPQQDAKLRRYQSPTRIDFRSLWQGSLALWNMFKIVQIYVLLFWWSLKCSKYLDPGPGSSSDQRQRRDPWRSWLKLNAAFWGKAGPGHPSTALPT